MTFTLSAALLIVALLLFVLAAFPLPEPYAPRLLPLGLAFLCAGLLAAAVVVP